MAGKGKSSANSDEPQDTIEDGLRIVVWKDPNLIKKGRGRPRIQYSSCWCDMLVEHMEKGLSFESFAGVVGISRAKLYHFVHPQNGIPEFIDAQKEGQAKSLLIWEKMGIGLVTGKFGKGANGVVWMMNMYNRFPDIYKVRRDEIADKEKEDELSQLSDDQLDSKIMEIEDIDDDNA